LIGGSIAGSGAYWPENLQSAGRDRMIEVADIPATVRDVKVPDDHERDLRYREFVRLLCEHERRLTAYVHALIPLWQDAEDVLQNTKLRLWEQFDSFRPDGDFDAWAIAVATYMVRAHRTLRQRDRVCFSDKVLEKILRTIPPETSPEPDERLSALVECVKTLNAASRRLLRLVCAGHKRLVDIARDLGQTQSATRMALLRARRSLFECVERRLREEQRQ
jgi:RNA polymerase sigma-70 factor, ECF subfamily